MIGIESHVDNNLYEDYEEDEVISSRPARGTMTKELDEGNHSRHKVYRKFCRSLIQLALEEYWEDHEIGKLIYLMIVRLDLDIRDILKFLRKCDLISPIVISELSDKGLKISPQELIMFFTESSMSFSEFIHTIEESVEQGLINLNDTDVIELLRDCSENKYTHLQYRDFVRALCSHLETKRECGQLLHIFTASQQSTEAAHFICDIITFDFFEDLEGTMDTFLKYIPEVQQSVVTALAAYKQQYKDNKAPDSDEDDNGNLMDFIVGDDVISMDSDAASDIDRDLEDVSEDEDEDDHDSIEGSSMKQKDSYKSKRTRDHSAVAADKHSVSILSHSLLNGKNSRETSRKIVSERDREMERDSNKCKISQVKSNSRNFSVTPMIGGQSYEPMSSIEMQQTNRSYSLPPNQTQRSPGKTLQRHRITGKAPEKGVINVDASDASDSDLELDCEPKRVSGDSTPIQDSATKSNDTPIKSIISTSSLSSSCTQSSPSSINDSDRLRRRRIIMDDDGEDEALNECVLKENITYKAPSEKINKVMKTNIQSEHGLIDIASNKNVISEASSNTHKSIDKDVGSDSIIIPKKLLSVDENETHNELKKKKIKKKKKKKDKSNEDDISDRKTAYELELSTNINNSITSPIKSHTEKKIMCSPGNHAKKTILISQKQSVSLNNRWLSSPVKTEAGFRKNKLRKKRSREEEKDIKYE